MTEPPQSRATRNSGPRAPGRVVSGGQTGVDRAALDVALALGIPCGGWCPAGGLAEDGVVSAAYGLRETDSADPAVRTRRNVRCSDATLILTLGAPDEGTELTLRCAAARPHRVIDLQDTPDPSAVRRWLGEAGISTLNVAGPRESNAPGIYDAARRFLTVVFNGRSA